MFLFQRVLIAVQRFNAVLLILLYGGSCSMWTISCQHHMLLLLLVSFLKKNDIVDVKIVRK